MRESTIRGGLRLLAISCAVICGFAVFGPFFCGFAVSGKLLRCAVSGHICTRFAVSGHFICGFAVSVHSFLRFYRFNIHSSMIMYYRSESIDE